MPERNIVEAINNALSEEMEHDPRVMVLGLDVGKLGGVFRTTSGLVERFGGARVVDTPLAEASIIGASLGLALAGRRCRTAPTPSLLERHRSPARGRTSRSWRGAQQLSSAFEQRTASRRKAFRPRCWICAT